MLKYIIKNSWVKIFLLIGLLISERSNAQLDPADIMKDIYKVYDSTSFLTFDIKYTYNSDTVLGNFTHDVLEGTYTLAGKRAKYNLGDIDFVQNDSFLIAVYNTDKYIIVTDPPNKNKAVEVPMKQMMDSLVNNYSTHYNISIDSVDSITNRILFTASDSLAQFVNFSIGYDRYAHLLKSVEYNYLEMPMIDVHDPEAAPKDTSLRKKNLKIEFSNYRGDNFSDFIYNENSYVFFEQGVYKPVKKYRNFRVFNTKAANIDVVEMPAQ